MAMMSPYVLDKYLRWKRKALISGLTVRYLCGSLLQEREALFLYRVAADASSLWRSLAYADGRWCVDD